MNAEAIFDHILSASLSASALIAITAGVQVALRRRISAKWRFALWIPVLLRLLAPAVPESRFSLFNVPQWFPSAVPARRAEMIAAPKPPGLAPNTPTIFDIAETAAPAATPQQMPEHKDPLLPAVWAGVSLLLLARLLAGTVWFRLRLRDSARPDASIEAAILSAAKTLKVRAPAAAVTRLADSPALFGIFRPTLLLPENFALRLSEAEIRNVLLHEMAHLKRRDLMWNAAAEIAQALHWFNPLVWLAMRQMRLEREMACDDLALRNASPAEARAYGETILRLLAGIASRPSVPAVVGIAEERSLVRARLKQITAPRGRRAAWPACVALVVLTLAGLTKAQSPTEQRKTDAAPQALTSSSAAEQFQSFQIPEFRLDNKTLGRAIDELRAALPEPARDVRFYFRAQTNITGGEGTFSVNAIGYIETDLSDPKNLTREMTLKADRLLNATPEDIVRTIGRNTAKPMTFEFDGERVTFYEGKPNDPGRKDRPEAAVLLKDARLLMELGKLNEAETKLKLLADRFPSNRAAPYYLRLIQERRDAAVRQDSLPPTESFTRPLVANANSPTANGKTNRVHSSPGRQAIARKLNEIVFERWHVPDPVPLFELVKELDFEAKKRDPEKRGINFIISSAGDSAQPADDPSKYLVTIHPALRDLRLSDVLDAIVRVARPPSSGDSPTKGALKFTIEDYAVVFSLRGTESEPLYTRTYKLDPNTFLAALERMNGAPSGSARAATSQDPLTALDPRAQSAAITEQIRAFFNAAGLNFSPLTNVQQNAAAPAPPQKALFYNDRTGVLFARATLRDMDVIETALHAMQISPPQVTFEVKAIRLHEAADFAKLLQLVLSAAGEYRPVLTDRERRAFESSARDLRLDLVAYPMITTLSERPARSAMEGEMSVDFVAGLERDHIFKLRAAALDEKKVDSKITGQATLFDGQTFLLGLPSRVPPPGTADYPKRIFLITPTLVDPAGNRVHSGEPLPFDADSIPPLTAR